MVQVAAAFHYKKFYSYDDAFAWYYKNNNKIINLCSNIYSSNNLDDLENSILFASQASNPFQFISKILLISATIGWLTARK